MELGIRLLPAGFSLSDTVSVLDRLGVERCRPTVHNWVQKADLQPLDGGNPDHVAVDERLSAEFFPSMRVVSTPVAFTDESESIQRIGLRD